MPGLVTDDAVDAEATALLEGAYRLIGVGIEFVRGEILAGRLQENQVHEDRTDLGNSRTLVSTTDRAHGIPLGRTTEQTEPTPQIRVCPATGAVAGHHGTSRARTR